MKVAIISFLVALAMIAIYANLFSGYKGKHRKGEGCAETRSGDVREIPKVSFINDSAEEDTKRPGNIRGS